MVRDSVLASITRSHEPWPFGPEFSILYSCVVVF